MCRWLHVQCCKAEDILDKLAMCVKNYIHYNVIMSYLLILSLLLIR